MAEFMTFCRGIVIVAIQMWCKGSKFIFSNIGGNGSSSLLRPFIDALPPIRSDWVDDSIAGVRGLAPLCVDLPVEAEYHRFLVDMTDALRHTSAYQAYEILCQHYAWWIQMPHDQFQRLVDPANQVATLLASHWIAVKQIMAPVTETERCVSVVLRLGSNS